MKPRPLRTVVLLSLVAFAGYGAYALLLRPTKPDPCRRLAELCGLTLGPDRGADGPDACHRMYEALDLDESRRVAACISEAKSCGEATGCTIGAAVKAGADVAKGFLGGLHKAMK
jgi:hypothetical protein